MAPPLKLSNDKYVNDFGEKIRKGLETVLSPGFDLVVEEAYRRPFSLVFFLRVENQGERLRLVAKKPLPHDDIKNIVETSNQAAVEFGILKDLYPRYCGVEGCSVPRPFLLLEEEEVLVMERAGGQDLNYACRGARFFSGGKTFSLVKEAYRNCGKWLHHLQSFTGVSYESSDALDTLGEKLRFRTRRLSGCGLPGAGVRLEMELLSVFENTLSRLKKEGAKVPVSGRHGDFGGWNVLVDGTGVTVIDFLGYERDVAALDFVKFLLSTSEKEHRLLYPRRRIGELVESFIEGYGEPPKTHAEVFFLCELYYRTAAVTGLLEQKHSRIDRKIDGAAILKSHLEWLKDAAGRGFTWETRLKDFPMVDGEIARARILNGAA